MEIELFKKQIEMSIFEVTVSQDPTHKMAHLKCDSLHYSNVVRFLFDEKYVAFVIKALNSSETLEEFLSLTCNSCGIFKGTDLAEFLLGEPKDFR